nr:DNA-3-methyladenine glycosylase I [Oceanococcus sp. HetDA_MAG_MS8]
MHDLTCPWATKTDIERQYHDEEWGRPTFDDRRIFEFFVLESAQAGLSWLTILRRRQGYAQRFANFDPVQVAQMTTADVDAAVQDTGIIRHRGKIEAAINNAQVFCDMQAKHGRFADYIWQFVEGRPRINRWRSQENVPATTPVSDALSRDLKSKGFRFFGSTIAYAHMQATGMVNDHLVHCPQHAICAELAAKL